MAIYDRVTPATLANYVLVINNPGNGEDANLLALYDLQTRRFIYDFLDDKFDDGSGDVLRPEAVADTTVAGKIKGATGNAGTQRAVVAGTISTPDLRDGAVTANKLSSNAITSTKVADGNITTTQLADAPNGVTTQKINDGAVTTAKLAALAVDNTKLKSDGATDANRAVTTDHIRDNAVTTAKIPDGAITGAKLVTATEANLLICQDTGQFAAKALSGAATIDKNGVLTLATTGYAEVREVAANTVAAGASVATTWNVRGITTAWVKDWETLSLVTLASGGKIGLVAGTYLIEASASAYKSDAHQVRVHHFNSADGDVAIVYGSSELASAAGSDQTRSHVFAKLVVSSGDYFKLEHYTTAAEATDGLGKPASAGGSEVYAIVKIHRIA